MIIKAVKQELSYNIYSKLSFNLVLVLTTLFSLMSLLNIAAVNDIHLQYQNSLRFHEEEGVDIETYLAMDYSFEDNGDGSYTVTNPLRFDQERLRRHLFASHPAGLIGYLLESSIVLFPLIFATLGLVTAVSDFKYRTIKIKTVRLKKRYLGISKQVSLLLSSFVIFTASLLFAYLIGIFAWEILIDPTLLNEFPIENLPSSSSVITRLAFGYFLVLFYTIIGYSLGIIFKNILVGIISISVYHFILPNLGIFSVRNSIFYLKHRLFDFYGAVAMEAPLETNLAVALIVLFTTLFIFIVVNMVLTTMRSSFST